MGGIGEESLILDGKVVYNNSNNKIERGDIWINVYAVGIGGKAGWESPDNVLTVNRHTGIKQRKGDK